MFFLFHKFLFYRINHTAQTPHMLSIFPLWNKIGQRGEHSNSQSDKLQNAMKQNYSIAFCNTPCYSAYRYAERTARLYP